MTQRSASQPACTLLMSCISHHEHVDLACFCLASEGPSAGKLSFGSSLDAMACEHKSLCCVSIGGPSPGQSALARNWLVPRILCLACILTLGLRRERGASRLGGDGPRLASGGSARLTSGEELLHTEVVQLAMQRFPAVGRRQCLFQLGLKLVILLLQHFSSDGGAWRWPIGC